MSLGSSSYVTQIEPTKQSQDSSKESKKENNSTSGIQNNVSVNHSVITNQSKNDVYK